MQNDIMMCVVLFSLYFTYSAKDYEVAVQSLELEEIIGQGQFGDVYKGMYKPPVSHFSFSNFQLSPNPLHRRRFFIYILVYKSIVEFLFSK